MKKGFTLIEIIISISIVLILGIVIIISFSVNKNSNYDDAKKILIEAANLYISSENDENGVNYKEALISGATAVSIPVKELYEKGYIDKEVIKTLEKNDDYIINNKNYVLAAIYSDSSEICDNSENIIGYKTNWDNELAEEVTYLCPMNKKIEKDNTLLGIIESEFESNGISGCIPNKDSGLCLLKGNEKTENGKSVYYYAGNVTNNVVKLGNDLFYIVRTTEDGGVKLIYNSTIDYSSSHYITPATSEYSFPHLGTYTTGFNHLTFTNKIMIPLNAINLFSHSIEFNLSSTSNFYNFPDEITVNASTRGYYATYEKASCSSINDWSVPTTCNYSISYTNKSTSFNSTFIMTNFLYKYFYINLLNWYNAKKSVIEPFIKEDYNWCDNSNYVRNENLNIIFKCKTLANKVHNFGILTIAEYNAILNGSGAEYNLYGNSLSFNNMEVTYDFMSNTLYTNMYTAEYYDKYPLGSEYDFYEYFLRPSIVVDGNILVSGGEGSISSPFILEVK